MPFGHESHWLLAAPEHDRHDGWHISQVFVKVFGKVDGVTHAARQDVTSKKTPLVHVKHSVLLGPLQVRHSEWQRSQVLVVVFSYTLVATHAVGHVVPSK